MTVESKIQEPLKSNVLNRNFVLQEVMYDTFVGYNIVPTSTEIDSIIKLGGLNVEIMKGLNVIKATLSPGAILILSNDPKVTYIEEIGIAKTAEYERRPVRKSDLQRLQTTGYPWGITKVKAVQVHNNGNRGAGVKVCIIDTGIDYNHENLQGVYKGGINLITNTNDPYDDIGHGTHVAGTIAGQGMTSSGLSIIGIAPKCEIYSVKVFSPNVPGQNSDVVRGLQWAIDNHMHIVNLSLGCGTATSITIQTILDSCYNAGILVVAAAGNNGVGVNCTTDDVQIPCPIPDCTVENMCLPAIQPSVVAVSATDQYDLLACFSSRGSKLEVSAPGDIILSTFPMSIPVEGITDRYMIMSGTSMACPHAVGVAALIKSANPNISVSNLKQKIIDGAVNLGSKGCYGYGIVNAVNSTVVCNTLVTQLTIN